MVANFESFLYSESPVMNSQRYEHSSLALQADLALISLVRHPFYLVYPKGAGSSKFSDGDSENGGTLFLITQSPHHHFLLFAGFRGLCRPEPPGISIGHTGSYRWAASFFQSTS